MENIVLYHHYLNTSTEATIAVLKAGLNLELTTSRKDPYFFTIGTSMCLPVKRQTQQELNLQTLIDPDETAHNEPSHLDLQCFAL